jgi:flavin-binding protein dodecin
MHAAATQPPSATGVRLTVTPRPIALVPLALLALLGGCTSLLTEGTAAGAGAAGAGISRAVTKNVGVTTGIGLGVQAAARAGLQYAERQIHQTEQDRIAAVAGTLPVGAVAHWQVVHTVPIEADEHGEVTVSRALGGGGFSCKEIVFSVDQAEAHAPTSEYYTATVCRDGQQWKWATAEPATERWGALQ